MASKTERMTTTALVSGALSFGVTPEAARRSVAGAGAPRKDAEAQFLPSDARARIPEFVEGSFVPTALKELVGYMRERGLALAGRLTDGAPRSRVVDVPTGRSVPAADVDRRLTVGGLRRMFGPTPTAPETASRRMARGILRRARDVLVPGGFNDFDDLAWSCKMVTGMDATARGRTLYLGPKVATATGDPVADRMQVERLKSRGIVPILPVRHKGDEPDMDLVPGMPILDRARSVTGGAVHWSLSHTVMAGRSGGASFHDRFEAMAAATRAREGDTAPEVRVSARDLISRSPSTEVSPASRDERTPIVVPDVVGPTPIASDSDLGPTVEEFDPGEDWSADAWSDLVGPSPAPSDAARPGTDAVTVGNGVVHASEFIERYARAAPVPDPRPTPVATSMPATAFDLRARPERPAEDTPGDAERRPIPVAVGARSAEIGRRLARRNAAMERRRAAVGDGRATATAEARTPSRDRAGRTAPPRAMPNSARVADAATPRSRPRPDGAATSPRKPVRRTYVQGSSLDDARAFVLRSGDRTKPLPRAGLPKGAYTVRDSNGVRIGTLTSDGKAGVRVTDRSGRTVTQRSRAEDRYLERIRKMGERVVRRVATRSAARRSAKRRREEPTLAPSPF